MMPFGVTAQKLSLLKEFESLEEKRFIKMEKRISPIKQISSREVTDEEGKEYLISDKDDFELAELIENSVLKKESEHKAIEV